MVDGEEIPEIEATSPLSPFHKNSSDHDSIASTPDQMTPNDRQMKQRVESQRLLVRSQIAAAASSPFIDTSKSLKKPKEPKLIE